MASATMFKASGLPAYLWARRTRSCVVPTTSRSSKSCSQAAGSSPARRKARTEAWRISRCLSSAEASHAQHAHHLAALLLHPLLQQHALGLAPVKSVHSEGIAPIEARRGG